ncbi:MAG: hypothetical protein P8X70_01015 [Nanoarchaeota archaeon]
MQILFTNPIAIIYFKTHLLTIRNKKTPLKNQEFHNITDIKTHNERQLQRSFISKGLLSKEKMEVQIGNGISLPGHSSCNAQKTKGMRLIHSSAGITPQSELLPLL